MIVLFLAMAFSAFSSTDAINAYDSSYPRDNTFCSIKNNKIEILIRSRTRQAEIKDRKYGELLFYRMSGKRPSLLPPSEHAETFRLFPGKKTLCSSSQGYLIDDSTFALLLLKENSPYKDKLVIQLFDSNTLMPKSVIETHYTADKVIKTPTGFAVRSFEETHELELGKVTIAGDQYIFHEKEFPEWINYSHSGFETSPGITFDKFPVKKTFKDLNEFQFVAGWDPNQKKFTRKTVYEAVNHSIKKRCYLFIEHNQKLTGHESWRCQTI